jgi:hypothetical protein
VLVNHPDAELSSVMGRSGRTGTATHQDRARVGADEPVGHMHERGLAGAVFAPQRMHLPGFQCEIGPAQSLHGAETLRDSAELKSGFDHRPVGCR